MRGKNGGGRLTLEVSVDEGLAAAGDEFVVAFVGAGSGSVAGWWRVWSFWVVSRKTGQSFRLRLHSGLRQHGAHPSRLKPRDEWGTRLATSHF